MTPQETQTKLANTERDWEHGHAIIARMVNIAFEQAGATVRVVSEPFDATGYTKGWHRGPRVVKAAKELHRLYKSLIRNLALLDIDCIPGWQILPDRPESTVNVPGDVRPWMLFEQVDALRTTCSA